MENILNDNENKQSMRNIYGEILASFGEKRKDIVVLDADLSSSTKTNIFAKKYPNRFFNVGIAEQNLITQACGLSLTGKKAYVSSFAMFATGRAWEQIRNTMCYNDLDVNGHANNGNYIIWAFEPLSFNYKNTHRIKTLDIVYRKEAKYGEKILSQVTFKDRSTTIHCLKNKNNEDLCLIECLWENL